MFCDGEWTIDIKMAPIDEYTGVEPPLTQKWLFVITRSPQKKVIALAGVSSGVALEENNRELLGGLDW